MSVGAIIAEYNPFHKGHQYQLLKTKEVATGGIIVIMSGNFVQRGEGAIIPKEYRVKAAIAAGADLVLELPLPFATATAQKFALGAVAIANATGVVDYLSMGSELGEIEPIIKAAKALDNIDVKPYLKNGITYAAARQQALAENYPELSDIIATPNNTLGVEYCRSINQLGSSITPITVKRFGADHNSKSLETGYASGTALRENWLSNNGDVEALKDNIPDFAYEIYKDVPLFNYALFEQLAMPILQRCSLEELASLPDISEGLENKVYSAISSEVTYNDTLMAMKSKRYTLARMRRTLLSATLGVTRDDINSLPPYIRVIGIGEKGSEILSKMKKTATLPFSHSLKELASINEQAARFVTLETRATDIYNLCLSEKRPKGSEYRYKVVRG